VNQVGSAIGQDATIDQQEKCQIPNPKDSATEEIDQFFHGLAVEGWCCSRGATVPLLKIGIF
jgi:hypothetical protein